MDWTKNQYGGFRNADNTFYLQQTPRGYYQVFRCSGNVWALLTPQAFARAEDAKTYAEGLA